MHPHIIGGGAAIHTDAPTAIAPAFPNSNRVDLAALHVNEQFIIGPYPKTKAEYWTGIVGSGVHIGVQLSRVGENYHLSEGESFTVLGYKITLDSLHAEESSIQRHYTIETVGAGAKRAFVNLDFAWPDGGLPSPEHLNSYIAAYRVAISAIAHTVRPIVHVHCGLGTGRSGTFVLTRAIECTPSSVSPDDLTASIKSQRAGTLKHHSQVAFATEHGLALRGSSDDSDEIYDPADDLASEPIIGYSMVTEPAILGYSTNMPGHSASLMPLSK